MPNQRSFQEEDLSCTGVLSVLSRNLFETLTRTIHVVDNHTLDEKTKENDKLRKVIPWLENMRQNFLKVSPEQFNSIDKIMVSFRGGVTCVSIFKINLINGVLKFGDVSGVSGFLYDFDVYQGRCNKSNSTFVVVEMLWQIYDPLYQMKKIIKCLLTTFLQPTTH